MGDVCTEYGDNVVVDDYDSIFVVNQYISGFAAINTSGYCATYISGELSGDLSGAYLRNYGTGSFSQRFNSGEFNLSNTGVINGNSSGYIETTGYVSGSLYLGNFTGILECYIDFNASLSGSGEVYGFGLGQFPLGAFAINTTSTEDSALSGIVSGYFTGIGNYSLRGSGSYSASGFLGYTGTGYLNHWGSGVHSGNFTGIDSEITCTSNGADVYIRSGVWESRVSGYHTGYCLADSPDFNLLGCRSFAPFRESCDRKGTLNVRINYPTNGQEFRIPISQYLLTVDEQLQLEQDGYLRAIVPTDSALSLQAYGQVISAGPQDPLNGFDPAAPFTPPSDQANDGGWGSDFQFNSQCLRMSGVDPTCPQSNGKIYLDILEDAARCNVTLPLSGVLTKQTESTPLLISTFFDADLGNTLEFEGLERGYYTATLSGVSGTLSSSFGLYYQPPNVEFWVINRVSSCFGNDGVIEARWSNIELSYAVEGTDIRGVSNTGLTIPDLSLGNNILTVTTREGCATSHYFNVEQEDTYVDVTATISGVSCSATVPNGSIAISDIDGPRPPYTVKWYSPEGLQGETGLTQTGLSVGLHYAHLTDASGCVSDRGFMVPSLNTLNAYITSRGLNVNSTVCCQIQEEPDYIQVPTLIGFGLHGAPPYAYEWLQGDAVISERQEIEGYPGEYKVRVTDSLGCVATSYPQKINASNRCLKIKWTSADDNGDNYREYIKVIAQGESLPPFPFYYSIPGKYRITFAASDGYGRSGIDCVDIIVAGYRLVGDGDISGDEPDDAGNSEESDKPPANGDPEVPNFPAPLPPNDALPDAVIVDPNPPVIILPPNVPDIQGDDEEAEDEPPAGAGGGGGIVNAQTKVCCGLMSSGLNDQSCKSYCFTDASFCDGRSALKYKKANNCKECEDMWQPQRGACCVCRFIEGVTPDLNREECTCHEISSCDPDAACAKLVLKAGGEAAGYYTHGFKANGNCDDTSLNYACTAGICCVGAMPNGFVGPVSLSGKLCGTTCLGRMSEQKCKSFKGKITNYVAATCEDAGAIEWDNQWYCDFKEATCCIKANPADSNVTDCNCFCSQTSDCKECDDQLAAFRASDPTNRCNYEGGAYTYTHPADMFTCLDLKCACGSDSSGVGGPL